MEAALGIEAAIDAARAVETRFLTASDDELLADGAAIERLGRLVDGMRIAFAAEADRRSDPKLGTDRLAFRNGVRDGIELVQLTTQVGRREARSRIGLGAHLAPATSILGEALPGRHPAVADAVREGRIGLDAAQMIVAAVNEIRPRVAADSLATMADALVALATDADAEAVRDAAADFALLLDPDGAKPRERAQRRKRALKLGQTLADGTTRLTMILTPEDLAFVKELLASRLRGPQLVRTQPGSDDDPDADGPEWRPEGDKRSRTQLDYDTAVQTWRSGAEATEPARDLQETVVTVTLTELEARRGQGFMPGILAGLPIPAIERRACTGGVRLLVTGDDGEILSFGRSRRIFSHPQRRALTVAAGGRCQYPGCRVPAPYLEAHHAEWWSRDDGPTDIDNGIMLCSFHHHLIHDESGSIRIVRHAGSLYTVPSNWLGPPLPAHRVRSARSRTQAA